jgi:hypothetical protein
MSFDLDGYVDVATRMAEFFDKYPEGSLRQAAPPSLMDAGGKTFVVFTAAAYRTPDDIAPGHGTAWELVPGKTQFTKDSELMNAETSAWGRAILAVGAADSRSGVASKEEVRNRQTTSKPGAPTEKQLAFAKRLADDLGTAAVTVVPSIIEEVTGRKAKLSELTRDEIKPVIDQLKEASSKAKQADRSESKAHDAKIADAGEMAATGEEPF